MACVRAVSAKNISTSRLRFPFLDTTPVWDIRWLLCLFPIWWLLGAEQIVWMAGTVWVAIKLIAQQRGHVKLLLPVRLLLLFVLIHLVSGLFVVESVRYVTFGRNFGTYIAGLAVAVVVTNSVNSWHQVQYLLKALFVAIGFSALVSMSAALDIWRPQFLSLIGQFLPEWILATDYGNQIAYRTVGQQSWFIGLGRYYRLNGFFLFATLYAAALVYIVPFLVFAAKWATGWRRWLWWGFILLMLITLLFTTARIPALSLLLGGMFFLLFVSRQRWLYQGLGIGVALFLMAGLAVTFLAEEVTQQSSVSGDLIGIVETAWYARGTGSPLSRFYVYENTLSGIAERPFFGWGTERHIVGSRLPAGSHSEYLAILYRQGFIGFVVHLGILASLWIYTRPPQHNTSQAADFLRYGRWFLIVFFISSISIVPVTDTTTFLILWLCCSLLLVTRKILYRQVEYGKEII